MTEIERQHVFELSRVLKNQIGKEDKSVTGFNVGVNNGASAGQTVMHAHIHLIPRRDGDIKNPRGGVRGVIPDKMLLTRQKNTRNYFNFVLSSLHEKN